LPADLHVHTTSSDGRMSGPRQVELAAAAGIGTIAIADHNAVSAVPGARFVGKRWGVEVIAGAELDANFHDLDMHIVGLFFDLERPDFQAGMIALQDRWRDWASEVLVEFDRATGIRVEWEDLYFWGDVPTGADLVHALQRYGYDGPLAHKGGWEYGPPEARFVPMPLAPRQVCDLIHRGGGAAILAHPTDKFISRRWTEPGDFHEILEMGIDGWECWRDGHNEEVTEFLLRWAQRLGMLPSGGSDYHGPYPPDHGKAPRPGLMAAVPDEVVEALRAKAGTYR